ncbi:hypothetical protein J27TS7_34040 [Paenibacillus dendritiformis]|uniref:hypothetical protein n=1 Tax=Paenibacillus dendritiformis TaxID=130049 RepID=UPI001B18B998|nr:hypothetical protein [Paenibacillus dendritiformis]GIO73890.1 hypothetical protein J27TS7_34040 [Paenibacillus dendritiformis]
MMQLPDVQDTPVVKEIIDFCPACGRAIVFGQEAWEIGPALVCSRVSCILKQIKAEKRRAGGVSHFVPPQRYMRSKNEAALNSK